MVNQVIITASAHSKSSENNQEKITATLELVLERKAIPIRTLSDKSLIKADSQIHITGEIKSTKSFCQRMMENSSLKRGDAITILLWNSDSKKHSQHRTAAKLCARFHQEGVKATVIASVAEMKKMHRSRRKNLKDGGLDFAVESHKDIRVFTPSVTDVVEGRVNQMLHVTSHGISGLEQPKTRRAKKENKASERKPKPSISRKTAPIEPKSNSSEKEAEDSSVPLIKPINLAHLSKAKAMAQNSEKEGRAPAIIHFIWIGGKIPAPYILTIKKLAAVAKRSGFTINLWVDDPLNYHKTAVQEDVTIANLHIRLIHELLENMQQDPLYQEQDYLKRFLSYINREMTGYKNLASASDFLRYEILRQFGGYYFDCDLEFILEDSSVLIPDELPLGIKVKAGFLTRKTDDHSLRIRNKGPANNDMIVALPQHPLLVKMIKECLKIYQGLDAPIENKRLTTMDKKRFPFFMPGQKENGYRFKESLQIGPKLIFCSTIEYINELKLPATDEVSKHLDTMFTNATKLVANIKVVYKNDLNWCRKGFDVLFVNWPKELSFDGIKDLLLRFKNMPALFQVEDRYFFMGYYKGELKLTILNKVDVDKWNLPCMKEGEYLILNKDELPQEFFYFIEFNKGHIPARPKTFFDTNSLPAEHHLLADETKITTRDSETPGEEPADEQVNLKNP